jgi:hypothetical protein
MFFTIVGILVWIGCFFVALEILCGLVVSFRKKQQVKKWGFK